MAPEAEARDVFSVVLALKALPELAGAHPDDLIALASRARERRLAAGEQLAGTGEPSVLFLVEGRVRDPREGAREAPAVVGLLAALAGDPLPALVAESDAVVLETSRAELLDALEDEFELWAAVLRAACLRALERRGGAAIAAPSRAVEEPACEPEELAERIALLHRTPPFDALPLALLGLLAAEMDALALAPGDVLWEPSEPATRAVAIVAGVAVARRPASAAGERLGVGGVAGLVETLAGAGYGFRLEAASPLRVLQLDGEALLDALEDDAASAVELLCAIARRERDAERDARDGAPDAGGGRGWTRSEG